MGTERTAPFRYFVADGSEVGACWLSRAGDACGKTRHSTPVAGPALAAERKLRSRHCSADSRGFFSTQQSPSNSRVSVRPCMCALVGGCLKWHLLSDYILPQFRHVLWHSCSSLSPLQLFLPYIPSPAVVCQGYWQRTAMFNDKVYNFSFVRKQLEGGAVWRSEPRRLIRLFEKPYLIRRGTFFRENRVGLCIDCQGHPLPNHRCDKCKHLPGCEDFRKRVKRQQDDPDGVPASITTNT